MTPAAASVAERVEPLVRQRDAPHQRAAARRPPATPIASPTAISSDELADDGQTVTVVVRRELDHADHQRDPDRVVRARLALEDRAGAAADLAVAEHREHDRRDRSARARRRGCRRSSSRSRAARARPAAMTAPASRTCRATPSDGDRHDRAAEAPPADVHAAVEEDHDQRDDADPLDRQDRAARSAQRAGRRPRRPRRASRKSAGAGIGKRSVSLLASDREREAAPRRRGRSSRRRRSRRIRGA